MSAATDALVAACQALTEALRNSAVDPADGVRILVQLIGTPVDTGSPDTTTQGAQLAASAMLRRCAMVSLARACASYNPASSTEALALRSQVVALFDTEIVAAADAGERGVYRMLRTLRSKVAADLTARGTDLPALVTLTFPQAEPSLVLAMRIYGDTYREPLMVARAGGDPPPVHADLVRGIGPMSQGMADGEVSIQANGMDVSGWTEVSISGRPGHGPGHLRPGNDGADAGRIFRRRSQPR